MTVSPKTVCDHLKKIDEVDPVTGALYRQEAQDVLATPKIALKIRQAIAELLNQANRQLAMKTAGSEDSY